MPPKKKLKSYIDWPQLQTQMAPHFLENFVIESAEPVSGGDSHQSFKLTTNQGLFFAKVNDPSCLDMFSAEMDGLLALNGIESLLVPKPIACDKTETTAFLVMQWLNFSESLDETVLAEALFDLHSIESDQYGWHQHNFIGKQVQHNTSTHDWAEFFWSYRIQPQLDALFQQGHEQLAELTHVLEGAIKQTLQGHQPKASLLHGDLWRGNCATSAVMMGTKHAKACLFDPAVYWGDAETDLAMAHLFGGFSDTFFERYYQLAPQLQGTEKRQDIYQLYHLLNHCNMFGDQYFDSMVSSIQRILNIH